MKTLKWDQVNAWRLAQHSLYPHQSKQDLLEVVKLTGGIQAQVMSAAELALGVRVDEITPLDVRSALWQERTLIKTWAMRAALHLITASELPLYAAARSLSDIRNWPYYFQYYGIDQKVLDEYLNLAPQILSVEPMKREDFALTVSEQLKSPPLYDLLVTKGWGTPLKPLAWQGLLCFGPNQGQNVTFVNARQWIGSWQPLEPYPALQEVLRRYLNAFGPATVKDFAIWWGNWLTSTRKLFKSLDDELELVDVEGWKAYALKSTLEPMQTFEPSGSVNLLPLFDAYTLGIGRGSEIDPILEHEFQKQVYRPQGWISAIVMIDGYIKGVWEYESKGQVTRVTIRLFRSFMDRVRQDIEAQTERLGRFLNTKVILEFIEN